MFVACVLARVPHRAQCLLVVVVVIVVVMMVRLWSTLMVRLWSGLRWCW